MSTSESETPGNNTTLVIALSTVLSVLGAGAIVAAACFCVRRRRRGASFLRRGITPIGDEEIATWKMDRAGSSGEKDEERGANDHHRYTTRPTHHNHTHTHTHTPNASTSTSRRAPSVIQYQPSSSSAGARPSLEPVSPRSFISNHSYHKFSLDLARPPDAAAVLARAPNARSGLTDETVPGDDPFLPSPKRHPSRLQKTPPGGSSSSPSASASHYHNHHHYYHHHVRTKGSRSSSLKSFADGLPGGGGIIGGGGDGGSPRASKDMYPRRTHSRIYSSSSIPPRLSFGGGDADTFTGLSPPPSRRADNTTTTTTTIGQALG
ncbi:hypothetical protein F4809DRAFT_651363 [Biscogniauxia mediterranea]|nr:hypothetical protein F4809DRAFT_651363 [Biscogniauxia mediterranea]